jgi:hypothetical protein
MALRGHYNYYGVHRSFGRLRSFFQLVKATLRRTLGRRSQNGHISWEKFKRILKFNPLLKPFIAVDLW